ncbi:hypothetical protein HORIV_40420 [Vreelandella olivaria]|uniref:LAGLIDADG endonuclease n=1 Tax=Vreelandella olivaria TaxID=390919 RepID=A0ABN5WXJ4_9GAMM|nr:hypothetical protein HORIV_40420 [Halomonas olivaria]
MVHFAPLGFDEWLIEQGDGTTIKYASYWYSLYGENPIDKGSRVIRIPLKQRFDRQALIKMMEQASKAKMIYNLEGRIV